MKKRIYGDKKSESSAKKFKKAVINKPPKTSFKYPAAAKFRPMAPRAGPGEAAYVTFIYTEKFTINPPALGLCGVQVFNLANLFDVNTTGVGHQPVNFDQYALMFDKYQVYRAEIKATMLSTSSQQLAGISLSDYPTTTTDPQQYVENGQTQWKVADIAGSGQSVVNFTMDVDLAAANGKGKQQFMGDADHESLFTGGPAENMYIHIWNADLQLGDPTASGWFVELRLYTKVSGSKLNALS